MTAKGISRRNFLGTAVGGALTATMVPRAGFGAAKPIVVGNLQDLTGFLAPYGYWYVKAAEAAATRINQEGGILGRPVKLIVEDNQSRPDVAVRKMRKLIINDEVDFVLGSVHSGIAIATAPVAKAFKTVHFSLAMTSEITGSKGNRYTFKVGQHSLFYATIGHQWAVQNLGKRWTIAVADYAYGRAHAEDWPPLVKKAGGEVLDRIYIPVGTTDFVPYLVKIPPKTEVLFHVFPGTDSLNFLEQLHKLGIAKNMAVLGAICTLDGTDAYDFMEGHLYFTSLPRLQEDVPQEIRRYDAALRQAVGAPPDGRAAANQPGLTGGHYWHAWTAMFLLKKGVELSKWQAKKDNPAFIEALEQDRRFPASHEFPQGEVYLRGVDHHAMHDMYIEQVTKGNLRLKARLAMKEGFYAPLTDFRKETL